MKRTNMSNQDACQSLLLKMQRPRARSSSTSIKVFGRSKPDLDALGGELVRWRAMLGRKLGESMTERADKFVELWIFKHLKAEGYQDDGDFVKAQDLAEQRLAAARAADIGI